ncbi:MAG: calcium-translocating P-type ATPase, SERCA-type [Clostridiaceae bacterium]|nr:calcium-translocating P-type ATPase, SERCA-type [Clostridiaceae bacterium]
MKPEKNEKLYHTMEIPAVMESLGSDNDGLSDEEARKRLEDYGRNEIEEGKKRTLFMMFLDQFKNLMIIILIAAAVISFIATKGEDIADTIIILAVVLINAVMGVFQESKAEKALDALKKMSSPFVRAKRQGTVKKIKTEELVPGDIVLIEAGDIVPADMRLIENASLKVEEAALTGESVPVEKSLDVIDKPDIVIGDRKNMVFSGSNVSYGRGTGIVVATGMNTEVGKIAGHLANTESKETPLQRKLAQMSKILSIGVVLVSIIIFVVGLLQNRDPMEMFLTSVSLAVAAIPEGLPAVVTIVLALGVQRMARNNAIIRKLSAVETLGSTEIICSDKTGTLTQNKMTVKEVFLNNSLQSADEVDTNQRDFETFINAMVLCNDSKFSKKDGKVLLIGDPTETALIDFAYSKNYEKSNLDNNNPRVAEIPFDSDRKLMSTINKTEEGYIFNTKGAPDVLLERCSGILTGNETLPMTQENKQIVMQANKSMADKALRVLAVAIKKLDSLPEDLTPENNEKDLIFVGLVGMIDPPRPEAKEAVRICKQAGIRPVMITGDHRDTAAAIAKELGIVNNDSEVITGAELSKLSDQQFDVEKYTVYARVSPEHKVRIVKAWKRKDKIVAMTGDGVNDAPALKTADIGVGMGITGTEVSKNVSDMVLTDDNFATIVKAVEEGRKIYSNIQKTIQFLLACNLGEVLTLFIGTMLGWTVLSPIHILWVNLITDTLPALALGMEKAEPGIMKRKPRPAKSSFYSEGVGIDIIYQGIIEGLITLAACYIGSFIGPNASAGAGITMAFATLGMIQVFHTFNVRSNKESIFTIGIFSNPYVTGAFLIAVVLQLSVIVLPFLNPIFNVIQLSLMQWIYVFALSFIIIPIVEIVKLFRRR